MDSGSDTLWTLRDGTVIPTAAVLLALKLENQGLRLKREGELLKVFRLSAAGTPEKPDLTPETAQEVRQQKYHLLHLVDYCEAHH